MNIAKSYKNTAVETASPGQLILMLYDGALKFLQLAEGGFEQTSPRLRNEQIHNNLIKVQNILAELQRSLDMKVGGDFSKNMFQLYDFMIRQLQQANIKKDREPIKIVGGMLKDIRDAWAEMLQKNKPQENAAADAEALAQARKKAADDAESVGGSLDASA